MDRDCANGNISDVDLTDENEFNTDLTSVKDEILEKPKLDIVGELVEDESEFSPALNFSCMRKKGTPSLLISKSPCNDVKGLNILSENASKFYKKESRESTEEANVFDDSDLLGSDEQWTGENNFYLLHFLI